MSLINRLFVNANAIIGRGKPQTEWAANYHKNAIAPKEVYNIIIMLAESESEEKKADVNLCQNL